MSQSVENSLKRLQTDYLDFLFLHDIEFGSFKEVMEEGIPALQKLKEQGKIRYYGVSGLPLSIFEKVLAQTDLDVILSYCHYVLNDQSLLNILPLLEEKGVGLINASPLSMGLLSTEGPPTWHPASDEIKAVCQQALDHCEKRGENLSKLAIQFSISQEKIPTTMYCLLKKDWSFIFSILHPCFITPESGWEKSTNGEKLHWNVDNYFYEGVYEQRYGDKENMLLFHRTLTSYIQVLLQTGFVLESLIEPTPNEEMLEKHPYFKDDFRSPNFIVFKVRK